MQHDHVLKKLNFDLLTPKVGGEVGGLRQKISYHVAAFVIPFYSITVCNMTIF